MANKRHKPEEIVTKLRQVEVLRGHPGEPLAGADAYDGANVRARKVAVLMTEGENTLMLSHNDGPYVRSNGAAEPTISPASTRIRWRSARR